MSIRFFLLPLYPPLSLCVATQKFNVTMKQNVLLMSSDLDKVKYK